MHALSSLYPQAHKRYESLPILGGVLEGLCQWLATRGYPVDALRRRVGGARLLDECYLRAGIRSLHGRTREQLLSALPPPTHWTAQTAGALGRSLAEYLEEQGSLASEPQLPSDVIVAGFWQYLDDVRGLAVATTERHVAISREFLHFLGYDECIGTLTGLGVTDIHSFLAKAGQHRCRASMQKVTATLRAFLRYLATNQDIAPGLDRWVDSPRHFRDERLPRALPWDSVRAILSAVNRASRKGKRDYAMFMMIATYGLRAGEVANIKLKHIAWRERQIRLPRSKVGTSLLLPLTDEVATALFDYLEHGRPCSEYRRIFLSVRAPIAPISSCAVTDAFQAWATLAGIDLPPRGGPHCLRHTLAMHLLRQGQPLKVIGDLLGHRSTESTCVYLRLNVEDLRDVALPLPGNSDEEVST